MRGLMRITYALNRQAALADWVKQCERARRLRRSGLIVKHSFPAGAGVKTIDAHMAALRADLDAVEHGEL